MYNACLLIFFFFLREVRNESVKPHFFLWQPHQNDILQDICPSFQPTGCQLLLLWEMAYLCIGQNSNSVLSSSWEFVVMGGVWVNSTGQLVIPDTDFLLPILFQLKSQSRILKSFHQKPRIPYQDTWNLGFSVLDKTQFLFAKSGHLYMFEGLFILKC